MKFDVKDYLKKRGVDFKQNIQEAICTCVWCKRTKHLYINTKNGNYVCFKCGEHGRNLLGLVCKIENCTFSEAARFVRQNAPEPKRISRPVELRERIRRLKRKNGDTSVDYTELPEGFVSVFKKGKWWYPTYLKERGVSKHTAKDFEIGFCDKGKYANRVVFPFVCPNGSSFTARDVTGYSKQKYLNAEGANRRSLLYGWQQFRKGSDLVLAEGPLDVLKLYEHGIGSLGLLGKTLSQGQFGLLTTLPIDTPITVMLDPETEFESLKIVKTLSTRFDDIYIAELPSGIDPGDSSAEQAWSALNQSEKIENSRLKISEKKLFHVKRRFGQLNA